VSEVKSIHAATKPESSTTDSQPDIDNSDPDFDTDPEHSDSSSSDNDDAGVNPLKAQLTDSSLLTSTSTSSVPADSLDPSALIIPGAAPKKPRITPLVDGDGDAGQTSLRGRLAAFLPQMAAANEELDELKRNGGLEARVLDNYGRDDDGAGPGQNGDSDGEGPYIEMNLGLGVLEEKREGATDSESDISSDEDEEEEESESQGREEDLPEKNEAGQINDSAIGKLRAKQPVGASDAQTQRSRPTRGVMDRLMARKRKRRPAGIEEV